MVLARCDVLLFKQKTAYEMRISDWSSDVCSSDLPRSGAHVLRGEAGQRFDRFGRTRGFGDELSPILKLVPVAALADEGFIIQPLGDDHMRHCGQHRDVGARPKRQMMFRPDKSGSASGRERVWQ